MPQHGCESESKVKNCSPGSPRRSLSGNRLDFVSPDFNCEVCDTKPGEGQKDHPKECAAIETAPFFHGLSLSYPAGKAFVSLLA